MNLKIKFYEFFGASALSAFFVLFFVYAAGAQNNWPVVFQGDLSFEPGVNYKHILDDAESVLKEFGIRDKDYKITFINDANQLIVSARDNKTKEIVWKTIKDIENNYYKTVRSEVISLEYANASEVAEMLNNIYSKKTYMIKDNDKLAIKTEDNNINISKDVRTNSIIVTAPQNIVGVIAETVKKLDRKTEQIHIKVLIAEISLDDTMQYGVEWKYSDNAFFGNDNAKPTAIVDYGYQTAAKKADLMGFKYSIISGDKLNMFLQMLRTESHIDVMASPELLTSNNMKAQFQETVKIPVLKTTSTSNGVISTSTEYQNIGIDLLVLPQVNNDGYINLEISQTIQNIIDTLDRKLNAPTYSNRVINTNVLVKNGSTVVIGGLFKNNAGSSSSKVPGADRVPLLGKLFGRNLKNNVKTELMVFLTPEITKSEDDFEKTVEELKAAAVKEHIKEMREDKMPELAPKNKLKQAALTNAEEWRTPAARANESKPEQNLCATEKSDALFENFKIMKTKIALTPGAGYIKTRAKSEIHLKSTARKPITKTKFFEKSAVKIIAGIKGRCKTPAHDKYKISIIENGREQMLKQAEKLSGGETETSIIFGRAIEAEETVILKIETDYNINVLDGEAIGKRDEDASCFVEFDACCGPDDPKTPISLSINFPDKIITKGFNCPPAAIDNAMDGTTLIWTQESSPLNITGFLNFEDAAKAIAHNVESEAK